MSAVLLTCGLGDFVAIDSFLTEGERLSVDTIHWATRARKALEAMVPFVFPNAQVHIIERDDFGAPFTPDFCVSSRDELPNLPPDVIDMSVANVAADVRAGARAYTGSRFVERTVTAATFAALERVYALPPRYMVVHPFSENARTAERDLTQEEWLAVQRYAAERDLCMVVLNQGGERLQNSTAAVLDLSDRTGILEAIEITKHAEVFLGCSSVFAAIAAKVLPQPRVFVKANHSVKRFFYWLYYSPLDTNTFVTDDLRKIIPHYG